MGWGGSGRRGDITERPYYLFGWSRRLISASLFSSPQALKGLVYRIDRWTLRLKLEIVKEGGLTQGLLNAFLCQSRAVEFYAYVVGALSLWSSWTLCEIAEVAFKSVAEDGVADLKPDRGLWCCENGTRATTNVEDEDSFLVEGELSQRAPG